MSFSPKDNCVVVFFSPSSYTKILILELQSVLYFLGSFLQEFPALLGYIKIIKSIIRITLAQYLFLLGRTLFTPLVPDKHLFLNNTEHFLSALSSQKFNRNMFSNNQMLSSPKHMHICINSESYKNILRPHNSHCS